MRNKITLSSPFQTVWLILGLMSIVIIFLGALLFLPNILLIKENKQITYAGIIEIDFEGKLQTTGTVKFPSPFRAVPSVVMTETGRAEVWIDIKTTFIDNNRFDWIARRRESLTESNEPSTDRTYVTWISMEQNANSGDKH